MTYIDYVKNRELKMDKIVSEERKKFKILANFIFAAEDIEDAFLKFEQYLKTGNRKFIIEGEIDVKEME